MKLKHLNLNFIDPLTRLGKLLGQRTGSEPRVSEANERASVGGDSILTETYLAATEAQTFPEGEAPFKVYSGGRCGGKRFIWTPHIPGENINIAPGVEVLAELRDGTWATDFAENLFWGIVRECPAVEIFRWRPLYPV